jgi:hypothetical protein
MANASMLHLKHEWTFYLIVVTGGPRRSYTVEELVRVGRLDTFVRNVVHFANEAPLSKFKFVNNKRPSLALFRAPIKPAWEDPGNKNGGTFAFEIPQTDETSGYIDEVWRQLQFRAVATNGLAPPPDSSSGGAPDAEDIVNGVIVTLKSERGNPRFVFEVWVAGTQLDPARRDHIVNEIKQCVPKSPPQVKFSRHRVK